METREKKRLGKINECFLGFTADPDSNVMRLTSCCGELMNAACALYNRLQDGMLYTLAQWKAPPDFNPVDRPDGHICHDVIKRGGREVFVVQDLQRTRYVKTDPNVAAYALQTYLGAPVSCNEECVGSLCVVYQDEYTPDEEDRKILQILAAAMGVEEERRLEAAALRQAKEELETKVVERTAELARVNEQLRIDVAERIKAEEELREKNEILNAITDTARDAVIMMENLGRISFWNPAAETIFGYSAAEALDRDLHEFLAPGGYFRLYKKGLKEFRETGQGYAVGKTLELEATRKGGDKINVELSLSTFQIKGKWHAAGILRDITERKKTEGRIIRMNRRLKERTEQLVNAQEELLRKEKLAVLGRLAGSVGHELRNPLGVISNAVYFLKSVLPDPGETVREYLDIIKQEVDNSLKIITDLLDFSRSKPPVMVAAPVDRLVDESVGRVVFPKNVTVSIDIPGELPMVLVDHQQVEQVLNNLINNAVEAMPAGGSLRISARKVESGKLQAESSKQKPVDRKPDVSAPGFQPETFNLKYNTNFVEISVADSGEGISEENMKKLFQPLFTTKARGIGLGLVVSRNLTEANGGRIAVESRPGMGATFSVALPASNSPSDEP
ncbi:MAG TPA: PAS domain S-box protein [Geobacteraceae bacterium]|nr:PAS domain S-box protein [Geobacteraceae bacterium]